jgi:hypothetical protein
MSRNNAPGNNNNQSRYFVNKAINDKDGNRKEVYSAIQSLNASVLKENGLI